MFQAVRIWFIFSCSTIISAQVISLGVRSGVPLSPTFGTREPDPVGVLGRCGECAGGRTLPYIIGPALEVHFSSRFSLTAEALYTRSDYNHTSTRFFTPASGSFTEEKHIVDRWELPVLLKYSAKPWHGMNPFVAGGVSFRYNQDSTQSRLEGGVNPPFSFIRTGFDLDLHIPAASTGLGGTFALGASFGSRRVRPVLEYRYTRWADQPVMASPLNPGGFKGSGPATLYSNQNQSQLLAGLMFDLKADDRASGGAGSASGRKRFAFGMKVGLPLTAALDARPKGEPGGVFNKCENCGTQRTLPYVLGPAVDIALLGPSSLSAEVLYSRADFNQTRSNRSVSSTNTYFDAKTKVDRVELPLLVKFAIAGRASVHPFIAAGASVQYNRSAVVSAFWGFKGTFGDTGFVVVTSRPVRHAFVAGPTAAAGVAFGSKRLRPSLEFRYTRWLDSAVETDPNPLFPYLSVVRSNQNQAQFLLGLMF